MTLAVFVKVFDGVVLAADSATTLTLYDNAGQFGGHQVYNTANKVLQLHRDLPVAAATWGLGQLGNASIASLAKDLRSRLTGEVPNHESWKLDADNYSVREVVDRLVELFYGELYSQLVRVGEGTLGFLVAGYSAGSRDSEAWVVELSDPNHQPIPFLAAGPDDSGWAGFAQQEASYRLFNGYDPQLPAALQGAGLDPTAFEPVLSTFKRPSAVPAMPLMDAIELARFLVEMTVAYQRFTLGPDTVGGAVDIAAISYHEGFKWIQRKHYYDSKLNPKGI